MAGATPGRAGSFVSKAWRAGVLLAAALLLAAPGDRMAFAEAGESIAAPEPPAPAVFPALSADEGPAVGPVRPRADPAHLEAARGAIFRQALAQPAPPRRVNTRAPVRAAQAGLETGVPTRARPAPDAGITRAPARAMPAPGGLIEAAAAAETGVTASPESWRRLIASRLAVWIAGIVLIGVPLGGLVWRHVAERRAERDLMESD